MLHPEISGVPRQMHTAVDISLDTESKEDTNDSMSLNLSQCHSLTREFTHPRSLRGTSTRYGIRDTLTHARLDCLKLIRRHSPLHRRPINASAVIWVDFGSVLNCGEDRLDVELNCRLCDGSGCSVVMMVVTGTAEEAQWVHFGRGDT